MLVKTQAAVAATTLLVAGVFAQSTVVYGGSNTVILVGLPRGEHKVRIEAVDPEGRPYIARTA